MKLKDNVLLFSVVLCCNLFFSNYVDAFQCYQCNSTHSDECLEMFEQQTSSLEPTQCQVEDSRYCIKITGAWGAIVGTQRFCSSRDLGNQCQYFGFDDHDRIYRGCSWTCNTENCNGSHQTIHMSTAVLMLPLILLIKNML